MDRSLHFSVEFMLTIQCPIYEPKQMCIRVHYHAKVACASHNEMTNSSTFTQKKIVCATIILCRSLCFFTFCADVYYVDQCLVSGWGKTAFTDQTISAILRKTTAI